MVLRELLVVLAEDGPHVPREVVAVEAQRDGHRPQRVKALDRWGGGLSGDAGLLESLPADVDHELRDSVHPLGVRPLRTRLVDEVGKLLDAVVVDVGEPLLDEADQVEELVLASQRSNRNACGVEQVALGPRQKCGERADVRLLVEVVVRENLLKEVGVSGDESLDDILGVVEPLLLLTAREIELELDLRVGSSRDVGLEVDAVHLCLLPLPRDEPLGRLRQTELLPDDPAIL